MRQIVKEPAVFADNCDVDSIINYYNTSYPKGKQLTRDNFKAEGIDLTKLDVKNVLATVRAQMLSVKILYAETQKDVNKILEYLNNSKYIAMDTETSNPKKVHFPEVFCWSLSVKSSEAFVIPHMFNEQVTNYLVTTNSNVVMHNAGYDAKIVYHMTGKHIKNYEDTMLMEYCYLNNSYNTPSLSLKNLTKHVFGDWKVDVTDLTPECINDDSLLYYAGLDSAA